MDPLVPTGASMPPSFNSAPLQPLMPGLGYPVANKLVRGLGQLSWLSPKAGLITCQHLSATVSFQLKDFCDQDSGDAPELNLEEFENRLENRQPTKDPYSLELEVHALSFLLSIFQKNGTHNISLSSLHSRISNSGRDDLYRYIGSSSLKRRQFIERRSYVFHITESDVVFLQPAEVYTTVLLLAGFLLRHGGATSSDALFSFFNNSLHVPSLVKESIQSTRANAAMPFAGVPPAGIPTFGGFDSNAAAAADQLALTQFNSTNQIAYGGMFSPEEAHPRNPWANGDTSNNVMGPSPPFGAPLDMNYGGAGTPTSGLPKNIPPGVIGTGPITRHNSVGSMVPGQFDMTRHNTGNDLRISCSPPISNLLGNVRAMVNNTGTQTEEFNEIRPIGVDPACRCQCNCQVQRNGMGKAPSPLKSTPASRQSSNGQNGAMIPPNSSGSTSSHESGLGSMNDMMDPFVCNMLSSITSSNDHISSVKSLSNAVASTASIWGQPKTTVNGQNPSFGFPNMLSYPPVMSQNNSTQPPTSSNSNFFDPFNSKQLEMKFTSLQL